MILFFACSKSPETARKELENRRIKFDESNFVENVKKGDTDIIKLFLIGGINPNIKDDDYNPILFKAIGIENNDIINILLKYGANINETNNWGETPLMFASERGNYQIVKSLLNKGANLEIISVSDDSALIKAARKGHLKIVELLLNNGADPNSRKDKSKMTALMIATENSHLEVVKLLLEKGADPNALILKGFHEYRVLNLSKSREIDLALVNKGASATTLLMHAAREGDISLVRILLSKGASATARDNNGNNALMHAIIGENGKNRIEIVKLLLPQFNSQQINYANKFGENAATLTIKKGRGNELLELLMQHGALPIPIRFQLD